MNIALDILSEESIDNAIRQLNVLAGAIAMGTFNGVDSVTASAKDLAEELYDGAGGVTVSQESFPEGDDIYVGKVYADGEQLAFVEFGAGYAAIADNPLPETGIETGPGTWSRQYGTGEFWNNLQNDSEGEQNAVWHYGGQVYRQVDRHLGMTNAKTLVQAFATNTVKEKIEELIHSAGY